jgi:hypothetical protein
MYLLFLRRRHRSIDLGVPLAPHHVRNRHDRAPAGDIKVPQRAQAFADRWAGEAVDIGVGSPSDHGITAQVRDAAIVALYNKNILI